MEELDAICAALKLARAIGYAFAVRWPAGHWTVETRKPSLRSSGMKVVDCDENGRTTIA